MEVKLIVDLFLVIDRVSRSLVMDAGTRVSAVWSCTGRIAAGIIPMFFYSYHGALLRDKAISSLHRVSGHFSWTMDLYDP